MPTDHPLQFLTWIMLVIVMASFITNNACTFLEMITMFSFVILTFQVSAIEVSSVSGSLLNCSLTSLSWLPNLEISGLISSSSLTGVPPSTDILLSSSSPKRKGNNSCSELLSPVKKCLVQSADFKSHPTKYSNSSEKPPFSYSTLLYLAIQQSKSGDLTLNEIYHWIKSSFNYYQYAESGWQVLRYSYIYIYIYIFFFFIFFYFFFYLLLLLLLFFFLYTFKKLFLKFGLM